MKFNKLLLIIFWLVMPLLISAQNNTEAINKEPVAQRLSLGIMYQKGYVFGTNPFLRGINDEATKISDFQAFAIKLSKQTTGRKLWEQLFNYPNWGLGIYVADFYDPDDVGVPIALYGFFHAPFIRWNKFTFNYEIGFGATFNWKSFDPITNQYNVAIGAGESFLIDAGIDFAYALDQNIDLSLGLSLTHFSNGAIKKPNFGINTIGPKLSLKYTFNEQQDFQTHEVPPYKKENEWLISVFGGVKNVIYDSVDIDILEKYEGVFYAVFGVSTTYNRQISYKSKIGIGMTASYDGSVNAQVAVDNNELEANDGLFQDKFQLSIYPSYELVIHKLSLILQPAFYIYHKKTKNGSPTFHQRIGLKYHFNENMFVGITLRDYDFHVSDYIEWNVGYRMNWN